MRARVLFSRCAAAPSIVFCLASSFRPFVSVTAVLFTFCAALRRSEHRRHTWMDGWLAWFVDGSSARGSPALLGRFCAAVHGSTFALPAVMPLCRPARGSVEALCPLTHPPLAPFLNTIQSLALLSYPHHHLHLSPLSTTPLRLPFDRGFDSHDDSRLFGFSSTNQPTTTALLQPQQLQQHPTISYASFVRLDSSPHFSISRHISSPTFSSSSSS